MGVMSFLLPDGLGADARRELERCAVAGGPDNMPTPTELVFQANQMRTRRLVDESGYLVVPWEVDGVGRVMGTTATLMERLRPYSLLVELARGKINQVRCQAADWKMGGLQTDPALDRAITQATTTFGLAVTGAGNGPPTSQETAQARQAIERGYEAARLLVEAYVEQVFAIRHQRSPKLDASLGCRVNPSDGGVPPALAGRHVPLADTLNAVSIPFSWHEVEAEEGTYNWRSHDELLRWAVGEGLQVSAGPLVDFASVNLPAWLWLWERDVPSMASFMCKFVEAAVRRYRGQIRRWQLSAGSNCATVLNLGEEELLGLTYRLADAARQVDPSLELVIGIAQPWGEYMASHDYTHSPFIFADTLIRSGINNLAALDIELVMGVTPRGSYCRDLLDTSRLLDLYALLGVPLRVTLGYPASTEPDERADPELRLDAGRWHDGFDHGVQAEWAGSFGGLALCKPFVQGVQWVHLSDAQPHQFPHCGLLDGDGQPRPALLSLARLRQAHLR